MPTIRQRTSPLTKTIERGDRFIKKDHPDRIYTVVGKVYHDDLTLSYRIEAEDLDGTTTKAFIVHEDRLKAWPWMRAWRAKRTKIHKEKIFTGVFYGTARG